MRPEIGSDEFQNFSRLRAKMLELSAKPVVEPDEVYDMLVSKESVLRTNVKHHPTDFALLTITLERWNRGERASAFEYLLREAFDGDDVRSEETFRHRALFFLKCAESLLTEPLCFDENLYGQLLKKIDQRRAEDPELWNTVEAAVKFNRLAMEEEADGLMVKALHDDYENRKSELFGPLTSIEKP